MSLSTSVDLYSFSSCKEQDAEQVCNLDCVGVEECGGSVSAGENRDQTTHLPGQLPKTSHSTFNIRHSLVLL